jgi:hypothetical protein
LRPAADQLVRLRSGDSPGAISHMERRLDAAIVGLEADRAVSELSNPARQALLAARICREAFPYGRASVPARAVLDQLPTEEIDPTFCSPAVRRLIANSRERM